MRRRLEPLPLLYMISIHDRICIGDQPISDEDFTRIGQEVQQMEQTLLQTQDQLSYFEIICLMALCILGTRGGCGPVGSRYRWTSRYHQCSDRRDRSDHFDWP